MYLSAAPWRRINIIIGTLWKAPQSTNCFVPCQGTTDVAVVYRDCVSFRRTIILMTIDRKVWAGLACFACAWDPSLIRRWSKQSNNRLRRLLGHFLPTLWRVPLFWLYFEDLRLSMGIGLRCCRPSDFPATGRGGDLEAEKPSIDLTSVL